MFTDNSHEFLHICNPQAQPSARYFSAFLADTGVNNRHRKYVTGFLGSVEPEYWEFWFATFFGGKLTVVDSHADDCRFASWLDTQAGEGYRSKQVGGLWR